MLAVADQYEPLTPADASADPANGKNKVTAEKPDDKTNRVADRFRRGNRRCITGRNLYRWVTEQA